MKNISVLILSIFAYAFSGTAQDLTSFYFTDAQPADTEPSRIAPDTVLRYTNAQDTSKRLVIEEDTLFTEFNVYMSLTKKELRKADTLEIRNGQLHGFLINDSLPVLEHKGKYYFGYPHRTKYFWPDDDHEVRRVNDTIYALNEKISEHQWMTTLLVFTDEGVNLTSFDHEHIDAMEPLQKWIEEQQKNNVMTYLASPPKDAFISFVEENGFNEAEKFVVIEEIP